MWDWPRTRVLIYVGAVALTALAFVAAGLVIEWKRDFWERQAHLWQSENMSLAAECKAAFLDLHGKRLHYEISRDPADRVQFETAAADLARWFDERSRDAALPETRAIWTELAVEYARYRTNATGLLAKLIPGERQRPTDDMLDLVEDSKRRFMVLDTRLASANRDAFDSLVARLRQQMDWLWMALYFVMALLLVCVAALAAVVYRDWIAPLRRTVAQSRAVLERQEKLNSLGLLAAGMAHEIRNPLNSIKARLFTQRRCLGAAPAAIEDNQFIETEIDRLEAILKDALQFARPTQPNTQRMRVTEVLNPLSELLRPALEKSAIQWRTDFAFDPELSLDPNQIKQAVLNLVNNSSQAIGRNGIITVRTRSAWLRRSRRRCAALAIEVQDTGNGISPEAQKRIFDPFFTTRDEGTGLGLPITARIVHSHHGIIECESQPGRGALFRILLPLTV